MTLLAHKAYDLRPTWFTYSIRVRLLWRRYFVIVP